jgi:hypothetical protein
MEEVVMNKLRKSTEAKPTKPTNKLDNLSSRARQSGFGMVELLFAASTLATTVLVAAMNSSKKPTMSGD